MIQTVSETWEDDFQKQVNALLKAGYTILNCGMTSSTRATMSHWWAILILK